jgi:hypothetical protein
MTSGFGRHIEDGTVSMPRGSASSSRDSRLAMLYNGPRNKGRDGAAGGLRRLPREEPAMGSRLDPLGWGANRWAGWAVRSSACTLIAAALTAFLVHVDAADPWLGGVTMPVTLWLAWTAFDFGIASRLATRAAVALDAHALAVVDRGKGSTPP